MNFQRGGDVKETLKIGRKANSFRLSRISIKAEATIPVVKDSLTNEIISKYNFREDTVALKMGFGFDLSENESMIALKILNEDGICRRLDYYFHDLILMKIPEKVKEYPDVLFDYNSKDIIAKLKWVLLKGGEQKFVSSIQLTFKTTGLDLLYRDQLYKIAPPRDGNWKKEERDQS